MATTTNPSQLTDAVRSQGPSQAARLTQRIIRSVLWAVLYIIISLIFLIPFIWMIFGSVREESEIFKYLYPFGWHTFFPIHWTLTHYLDVLGLTPAGKLADLHFGLNIFNSFFVSTAVVVCSLIFNTMGAYFFARLPFPHKNVLFVYVIATLLVPLEVTMVPLYIVVRSLKLEDTYWSMIIPWFASPFVIFSLIQFMRDIPYDLDEAALIDGAGYFTILWKVIVPNATAGLVTNALLEFQFIWNLFFWPLIAVNNPRIQVLQVAISGTLSQTQQYWGRTFAGASLASVPVILIFLIFQRYYVAGVATTGIKG